MKMQILTFSLLLFVIELFSQTIKYSDLNGEMPVGKYQSYVSKNGEIYSVGDTLRIGVPLGGYDNFLFVQKIDIMGTMSVVGSGEANTNTVIKKISAGSTASLGWKMGFQTQGLNTTDHYFLYIEDAIVSGEVKHKGMTSDEASIELKKAEVQLDFEFITQEEYDKIKTELSKYIK